MWCRRSVSTAAPVSADGECGGRLQRCPLQHAVKTTHSKYARQSGGRRRRAACSLSRRGNLQNVIVGVHGTQFINHRLRVCTRNHSGGPHACNKQIPAWHDLVPDTSVFTTRRVCSTGRRLHWCRHQRHNEQQSLFSTWNDIVEESKDREFILHRL